MFINEGTERRLKEENHTRAPIIKQIIDAAPMFKERDFDSWTTERITDLAGRVTNAGRTAINLSYANVQAKAKGGK